MVNARTRPSAFNAWDAFVDAAEKAGDRAALIFAHRQVSFADLQTLALRAAAFLAARGVRRGDVVMLQLPKRVETYALILACLRLGAAHCCVDPKNPPIRTARMLERVRPKLFFTMTDAKNEFGDTFYAPLAGFDLGLERGWPAPLDTYGDVVINGADAAYVMFTSGSTGEPKGAVLPHQGVLSLMAWSQNLAGDPAQHRFTAINPLHFDNMVFDTYCGLISGSAIVPVETSEASTPQQWAELIRQGGATVFYAVPTLYQMLDDVGLLTPEVFPNVKLFVFAGEGFPIERLRKFHDRFKGQARLVNAYGPTETSCLCSSLAITDEELAKTDTSFPSLGYMFPNFDYAVLDDAGRPVAPGVAGELCIGGPAVALGYYNNADETARRFIQDPRQSKYRSIFYRSGDLVREDADGKLWFVGRVDNQVKFGSFRVELEEIDHAVQSIPGMRRAVCVVQRTENGDELCVAYSAERAFTKREVVDACRDSLPVFMLPSQLVQLEDLPRNANGKVDRLAVKKLFADMFADGGVRSMPMPVLAPVEIKSMPAPVADEPVREAANTGASPVAEIEDALCGVWADVLGLPDVGRSSNFFDLGGTSLLLRRAHGAIQARYAKTIPIVALFEHPTIAALAAYLAQGGAQSAVMNSAKARAARQAEALRRMRDTRA